MNSLSIDEVYERNDKVADRLEALIGSLDKEQLDRLPEAEKWTIGNIVEHVSIVESGMIRICSKLLREAEAEGKAADGMISATDSFMEKTVEIATLKLEAPEIVQPSGEGSIEESTERLKESRQHLIELKSMFEQFNSTDYRFPHPFLGELSAGEWLMLVGGHKLRHIKQIERLASL
jgi:DinB superfamily